MDIPKIWSFQSEGVAEGFDSHVRNELPWYELSTWAVATIGAHFIPQNGIVYDIGASTGNIGSSMIETIQERKASLYAIESEKSMEGQYTGPGQFVLADALEYDYQKFDFACLFLTMMFLPIKDRKDWLASLVGKMNKGGAIVIFDKIEPQGGFLSTAIYRMTLDAKLEAGVEPRSIIGKELSLKGVQRPLQAGEIPDSAQEIFRFGHFVGWVITG